MKTYNRKTILICFLFLSLLLGNRIFAQCPAYGNPPINDTIACSEQDYHLSIPNTECHKVIYLHIVGTINLGGSWKLKSVKTGTQLAGEAVNFNFGDPFNHPIDVYVGPIDSLTQGTDFNLIASAGNFGSVNAQAQQNGNTLANTGGNDGTYSFTADAIISSSTLSVTTPSGIVTTTESDCGDFNLDIPLSNPNFCTTTNVNIPWSITCDSTGAIIDQGTQNVTILPKTPSAASDVVSINWNTNTCSWDVSGNNDCGTTDIGNIFSISPNPATLPLACSDGNQDFTITYSGVPAAVCPPTSAPSFTIHQAYIGCAPILPDVNVISATCSTDGSATISNYDGTLTYSFTPAGPTVDASGNIANATLGTNYSVSATNTNGCTSPVANFTVETQLTSPVSPTVSTINPTCSANGSAAISNYDGTLTYSFTPTGPTVDASGNINNATLGISYTLAVAQNGCTASTTTSFTVDAQFSTPTIPTISVNAPTCSTDGSATISNYDGTLTYSFTPAGPTVDASGNIANATLGTNYSVSATNTNGCTSPVANFTVEAQLTSPVSPTVSTINPTCSADGSATISNYDGTLTYSFTPTGPTVDASGNINNATLGTSYTLAVAQNGCTASTTTSFTVDAQFSTPIIPTISVNAPTCTADGSATISNYDGTLTYSFTPAGPTVDASGNIANATLGTNYSVSATNTNGCTSPVTNFTVEAQLTSPVSPTVSTINPTCSADGSAAISNYDGTLTYSFTPTGPTVDASGNIANATLGTNYTLAAAQNGCTASTTTSFTVDAQFSTPIIPTISVNAPTCSADGSASISNYDGTLTYSFTPTGPTVDASGNIANATLGTSYSVSATNSNGCTSPVANFTVETQFLTPNITLQSNADTVCLGDSAIITISNPTNATITWNPSISSGVPFVVPSAGYYVATAINNNGCQTKDSVKIEVYPEMTPQFTVDPKEGCMPLTVHFFNTTNISGASNCLWDFGDGETSTNCDNATHIYTQEGNYSVGLSFTTSNGCIANISQSDLIVVHPQPKAIFTADRTTINTTNLSVNFNNQSTNATDYSWDFGDDSPSISSTNAKHSFPFESGKYTTTLIASNGPNCIDSAKITIKVTPDMSFYIPNTFTPNGNALNNIFQPVFPNVNAVEGFVFQIFNRWGELLFESHDPTMGWDGAYHGDLMQDGTYIWKIQIGNTSSVKRKIYTGTVNLIR